MQAFIVREGLTWATSEVIEQATSDRDTSEYARGSALASKWGVLEDFAARGIGVGGAQPPMFSFTFFATLSRLILTDLLSRMQRVRSRHRVVARA